MAVILEEKDGILSDVAGVDRDLWHQLIVAITIGGAAVFALLSGIPTEKLGRKITILSASAIFAAGSVVMGLAGNKEILLVGRLIVGAAIGIASTVVPVYISEAAPMHLRGTLTVSYNTLVVAGQFIATLVCGAFANVDQGWRWMLGLAGVPAVLQFVGFMFMPESPRWLLSKGKEDKARDVLKYIRPANYDVDGEIRDIQENIKNDGDVGNFFQVGARVMNHQPTRRALILGCSLMVFQQISGINTIMYYSATVVQMAGIGSASSAIWITAIINGMYLLACLIGILSVERLGRKKLLLGSLAGVILSLLVIAVGFQLADMNSPSVDPADVSWSSCGSQLHSCSLCVQDGNCGYCEGPQKSFCLTINGSYSESGPCSMATQNSSYSWYPDYCPTTSVNSWTIIVGLAAYLISFAAGIAPVPWTMNSEIYPLWSRSFCTSVSTCTNWSFNLIIAMTFLFLTTGLTRYGAFYLYCGLAVLGWVIFLLFLPETQGRTLEQMESLFSGKVIVLNKKKISTF
eukprot:GFUD01043318.1.p1 GENE.GFUD01043318.1~~GFUD01043318.1.p1  ORF type:complete len:517 (+),score=77.81 GFUD01043318.1:119-1669(+)